MNHNLYLFGNLKSILFNILNPYIHIKSNYTVWYSVLEGVTEPFAASQANKDPVITFNPKEYEI